MIRAIIFTLFLIAVQCAYSLDVVRDYYTVNDGQAKETNGYYYSTGKKRLLLEGISGPAIFIRQYVDTVYSYYSKTNVLRSKEVYNAKGILEGPFVTYHENGKIKDKGRYANGSLKGHFMSWYPDGKAHRVFFFFEGSQVSWPENDFKIVSYWDSLGNQLVNNGNGYCRCKFFDENKELVESGIVKDGVRDSVWVGQNGAGFFYRETYQSGRLVGGVSYANDKTHPYKEIWTQAEYKGGLNALGKFISSNLRFPKEAKRNRFEGQSFVKFMVERDGVISTIALAADLNESLDAEAMRVVRNMPRWIPGKKRGIPAKTSFVLPIRFKLER